MTGRAVPAARSLPRAGSPRRARDLANRCRATSSSTSSSARERVGLVQALEGFEPERGLAFSTFAVPRIRGAILDELRRRDWVPRSVRSTQRQLDRVRAWSSSSASAPRRGPRGRRPSLGHRPGDLLALDGGRRRDRVMVALDASGPDGRGSKCRCSRRSRIPKPRSRAGTCEERESSRSCARPSPRSRRRTGWCCRSTTTRN